MCTRIRSPRAPLALICVIAWLCVGAAFVAPSAACASGWPFESARAVVRPYGSAWETAPGSTHRGIDLAAAEGDSVIAPEDATVSFSGLVPTDSGRVRAVTLVLADGRRMTLMPLESAVVSAGEGVGAGEVVGRVAAEGDASTTSTHLHVSLRRGETYLDPMTALAVPVVAGGDRKPAQEPVGVPAGSPSTHGARAGSTPSVGHAASAGSVAGVGSGITLADGRTTSPTQVTAQPAAAGEGLTAASPARGGATAPRLEGRTNPDGITLSAPEMTPVRGFGTDALISRAYSWARSALPSLLTRAFLALLMLLAGAALLWPLWRRTTEGEPVGVRPGGDDVAAAVSR